MNSYYPEVIRSIAEFNAIIEGEYPEFDELSKHRKTIVNDAYLSTMCEERVEQWENILGITPLSNSSIEDRRDTIIARIRGQGKLNTELINSIVNAFTGGTAHSWIEDSVLYVEITPPPENKTFLFPNVEQELKQKVPAHLGLQVSRNYYTWGEINKTYNTWQDVKDGFTTWTDVYLFSPFTQGR